MSSSATEKISEEETEQREVGLYIFDSVAADTQRWPIRNRLHAAFETP
jgi:hypothetical protein